MSSSSPAASNARSTHASKPVETISCCGSPRRRSSGGSPASQACNGDGSTSRSSARCSSSCRGPMPFRAATACETYARPRPPVAELESLREQHSPAHRRRRRPTRARAPGRAGRPRRRAAPRRSGHRAPEGQRARASAPGAGSTRRGPGAPGPARCRARRRGCCGRRGRRTALRPADPSDRGRASAAPAAVPAADAGERATRLRHELRVDLGFEIRGDPVFEHPEAKVLEPVDLGLREVLELRVGERRAAPERERLAQELRPLRRLDASRASVRAARSGRGRADRRRARAGTRRAACAGAPVRAACVAARPRSGARSSRSAADARPRAR